MFLVESRQYLLDPWVAFPSAGVRFLKVVSERSQQKATNFRHRVSKHCFRMYGSVARIVRKVSAVAGAECNTVIELKLEHHAA